MIVKSIEVAASKGDTTLLIFSTKIHYLTDKRYTLVKLLPVCRSDRQIDGE